MSEKTKKGFKMPSSFSVLLIIIAIMAVLTWINTRLTMQVLSLQVVMNL